MIVVGDLTEITISTANLTNRQEYNKRHHKAWVEKNREKAKSHDTKYRNSPKGLATRKRWDDANRESRNQYFRDYRKSLKLQK